MRCDLFIRTNKVTAHPAVNVDGLKPCQFRQVDAHGHILCNLIKGGDREVSVNLCRVCPVQQINCQHLRAGLQKKVSTPITVRFATGKVEVWDDEPPTIDFKQAACAAKTMPIHSPRDCAGCPIRLPNVIPQNAIQAAHRAKGNTAAAEQSVAAQTNAQPTPPPATPSPAALPLPSPPMPVMHEPRAAGAQRRQTGTAPAPVAVESNAASDLVARAQATARKKAQEQPLRAAEQGQVTPAPSGEAKPKIIQLHAWLAGQLNRKQQQQPLAVQPDQDGVSDIIYAPLGAQPAQAFQETPDYERCVGWTD